MTRKEALTESKRLIDRDADEVYDACANYGQIASNLPPQALRSLVADWLEEN